MLIYKLHGSDRSIGLDLLKDKFKFGDRSIGPDLEDDGQNVSERLEHINCQISGKNFKAVFEKRVNPGNYFLLPFICYLQCK